MVKVISAEAHPQQKGATLAVLALISTSSKKTLNDNNSTSFQSKLTVLNLIMYHKGNFLNE